MLSTKQTVFALKIVIPLFIAVLSIFVFATQLPKSGFVQSSIESLDNSKVTVERFAGGTMLAAVGISALPGDFASPLSATLAGMEKYFVFIFVVLFIEKMIVTSGLFIAFRYLIPLACLLYIIAVLCRKDFLKNFSVKLVILALSMVLVIPFSTCVADKFGADYMDYVNQTIEDTEAGTDKINDVSSSGESDKSILDILSDAFTTSMSGINGIVEYFKNQINRCMNSIAILIIVTFVVPVLVLLFFKWLLGQLFSINIDTQRINRFLSRKKSANGNHHVVGEPEPHHALIDQRDSKEG